MKKTKATILLLGIYSYAALLIFMLFTIDLYTTGGTLLTGLVSQTTTITIASSVFMFSIFMFTFTIPIMAIVSTYEKRRFITFFSLLLLIPSMAVLIYHVYYNGLDIDFGQAEELYLKIKERLDQWYWS